MSSTPVRSRTKNETKKRKQETSIETSNKKQKTEKIQKEKENEIFSILKPETIKKIEKNEKILINNKILDEKLTLKLQYNQLDKTLRIIRDLFKQKKRTAMYKDQLIIEIINLSSIKKTKIQINDELNLILKLIPEW